MRLFGHKVIIGNKLGISSPQQSETAALPAADAACVNNNSERDAADQ